MTEQSLYAALLIDVDSREYPVFRQVQAFSADEYETYRAAHAILDAYLDVSMFTYVKLACIDLMDYIVRIGQAANDSGHLSETDEREANIFDVLCSLTLAAANSFFVVQDQHRLKAQKVGTERGDETEAEVIKLFCDLEDSCFEYRTILNLRNALVHVSIRSLHFSISIGVGQEPQFVLDMSREEVLTTRNLMSTKPPAPARRAELEALPRDPAVFQLLEKALPEFAIAEGMARDVLYPDQVLTEAAETVCELIDVFGGKRGVYCMQTGPGLTREHRRIPQHSRLNRKALALAEQLIRPTDRAPS